MKEVAQWRPIPLILAIVFSSVLLGSLFIEPGASFWKYLDDSFFWTVNSSLDSSPIWYWLWALANNRGCDVVAVACMIGVFFYEGRKSGERHWTKTAAQFFMIAVLALVMVQVGKALPIERASATVMYEGAIQLSDLVPQISLKDKSGDSFPGDHGIALFIFAGGALLYLRRSYAIAAVVVAVLFTLPRMMSGAHWLSDELVGAVSIGWLGMAVFVYTPLRYLNDTYAVPKLASLLNRLSPFS